MAERNQDALLWTRRGVVGAGIGTGVALAAGCTSGGAMPPPRLAKPIRVAARPDVLEVGPILHAAQAMGPDRIIVSGGGVPNLIDGPVAGAIDRFPGRADAAGQAETQLLRLSVANPDLRIVMTVTEGVYRIVARRSAGIARVADLAGKRVGIFERTSAAFFLHRMLDHFGLGDTDIVRVSLRPQDMAKAMIERRVDAIAIWEPQSERTVRALGADAVTFADPDVYREFYNLNTTAAVLADPARRASLVAFMRVLVQSCRISVARPSEVWPLVAASSGFPPELVEAGWPHHRFPATIAPALLDTMVAEELWLAAQDGRMPRPRPELDRLIDPSPLTEADVRT